VRQVEAAVEFCKPSPRWFAELERQFNGDIITETLLPQRRDRPLGRTQCMLRPINFATNSVIVMGVVMNSLIGAMGCASWRVYERMLEHGALNPTGNNIVQRHNNLITQPSTKLDVMEVGLTDLTVAALWRYGPAGLSYGVSSTAESNFLGADIAFLFKSFRLLLLYQAKVAELNRGVFILKSKLPAAQARLLRQPSIVIGGQTYRIDGRLALYQADHDWIAKNCQSSTGLCLASYRRYRSSRIGSVVSHQPDVGVRYLNDIIQGCGCSAGAIVCAHFSNTGTDIESVNLNLTHPWEWFKGSISGAGGFQCPIEGMDVMSEIESDTYGDSNEHQIMSREDTDDVAREIVDRLGMDEDNNIRMHLFILE